VEVVELPVLSPKSSMIVAVRSYSWMEQEIMDEEPIEKSVFQKTLEVIDETSAEVYEEKDDSLLKVKVDTSRLDVHNQDT
jgi:hypothetical protein